MMVILGHKKVFFGKDKLKQKMGENYFCGVGSGKNIKKNFSQKSDFPKLKTFCNLIMRLMISTFIFNSNVKAGNFGHQLFPDFFS